ncbi:BTAD domain-containing putative transcriptional regulator [Nocardia sp. XZ_19_385]|uniref:BTAD domain-containing putative transcriptional regulator n=1 Tax=Nocardia sp. XZ_19_385 TaxID=2769488 RepID=UPI0018904559|nr:BTAD domain-containing putative transcriptional regulator [Nocardia sp. XZ_19_385]
MESTIHDGTVLDVRVLGPVRLLFGGTEVPVPGVKLRALLAILAINRRRAVPKTALVQAIWEEGQSARSVDGLYAYISNLRTVLRGAGVDDRAVLRTVSDGYLLEIRDAECDVGRFELARTQGAMAAAAGDSATAARHFAAALAQWSGEPVAGLHELRFAGNFATDMAERRLNALADRLEADIGCGRAGAVIGELTALTAEHPVNERLWRLLITALYRAGRQADALAACLRIRRNLADEQGIDPDPRTVALEEAVRGQQQMHTDAPRPGATTREAPEIRRRAWLRVGENDPVLIPPLGLRIGRAPDNDVVLDDNRVSRKHARILHREDGVFIRDRDSANGVYVNGAPIGSDTPLSDGDVIRVGSTTLRFELRAERPVAPQWDIYGSRN